MLGHLEDMGFPRGVAQLALDEAGGSLDAAVECLLNNAAVGAAADADADSSTTPTTAQRRASGKQRPAAAAAANSKKRSATGLLDSTDDVDCEIGLESGVSRKAASGIKVLDKRRIVQSVETKIEQIASTLAVPHATASALLRFYKWDEQKLTECYFEDPDRVLRKAGIAAAESTGPLPAVAATDDCGVCFEPIESASSEKMACGHRFCDDCWGGYLKIKVTEGGSLGISCMGSKCPCKVPSSLVQRVVPPNLWAKYQEFVVKSFIEDNPNMRWCPAPGCGNAVQSELQAVDEVQCSCGFRFCFRCNDEAHPPVPCARIKDWAKRCKEDCETKNWIVANTKDCPNCGAAIEKNGGCNYVQCFKCQFGLCWVCMGPHDHNMATHKCKPYQESTEDKQNARASLEKYLHYYNRYSIHEQSKKLEEQLRHSARARMDDLRSDGMVNTDFLEAAVEQLFECRRTLKYTYVYAFYCEGQEKILFEFLQNDLEVHTERLSGALEAELKKPRQPDGHAPLVDREAIANLSRVAARMLKNLLDGVRDGLMEGAGAAPDDAAVDQKPSTAAPASKAKAPASAKAPAPAKDKPKAAAAPAAPVVGRVLRPKGR